MDLINILGKSLNDEQLSLLSKVAAISLAQGVDIYLVGGAVRDILLDHEVQDLDLVIEGNAEIFAYLVATKLSGSVKSHSQFATATLNVNVTSLDFISARSEQYPNPGHLPVITFGSIEADLARRDFSINALAINVSNLYDCEIIDLHNGLQDLQDGIIRILHPKSFSDDATRILRALRYEQRLGFKLEDATQISLLSDLQMLNTISGQRLMKEIHKWFKEDYPYKIIQRAHNLGVFPNIHKSLNGLQYALKAIEIEGSGISLDERIWLGLMLQGLSPVESRAVAERLRLSGNELKLLAEVSDLYSAGDSLSKTGLSSHDIYSILSGKSQHAITVYLLMTKNSTVKEHLSKFLHELRHIKPYLTGKDLIEMGIPKGPSIGNMLESLLYAKLDGIVKSRNDELELVSQKQMLT